MSVELAAAVPGVLFSQHVVMTVFVFPSPDVSFPSYSVTLQGFVQLLYYVSSHQNTTEPLHFPVLSVVCVFICALSLLLYQSACSFFLKKELLIYKVLVLDRPLQSFHLRLLHRPGNTQRDHSTPNPRLNQSSPACPRPPQVLFLFHTSPCVSACGSKHNKSKNQNFFLCYAFDVCVLNIQQQVVVNRTVYC